MLQVIRESKSIAGLLVALVVFAMWSKAIAGVFCPHMSGGRDCCSLQKSYAHSPGSVTGAFAEMNHKHMNHEQMSDMDMQDGSMDMSDSPSADVTDSPQRLDLGLADSEASQISANQQAVIQPNETCSHCMMHSQSGASLPVKIAGQSNPSYQVVADTASAMSKNVSTSPTFVELHDHGPPAPSAPVYVLVSAFRI